MKQTSLAVLIGVLGGLVVAPAADPITIPVEPSRACRFHPARFDNLEIEQGKP